MLTGGGSAGHVIVNLALIPQLQQAGWQIGYIGSADGIERQLLKDYESINYHHIATGKLRRYFDWNNFKDPFRVVKGVMQAYRIIKREKPKLVFSKGGFVSVPVIMGAWLNKVPAIIHESDLTPGLANKISTRFAQKVCYTFPETSQYLNQDKAVHVGPVIRGELRAGNRTRGYTLCQFTKTKPVLLVMGGSLGSQRINAAVREALPQLLQQFQIVHLCGKGQVDETLQQRGYCQFEYLQDELPDVLAFADVVVSRAGANAIFEFLALQKPMLLIPLPLSSSRGDQILNARSFEQQGFARVISEEDLTEAVFLEEVQTLYKDRNTYCQTMEASGLKDGLQHVIQLIDELAVN